MPFLDLKAINLRYEEEFRRVLERTLQSGWFILGEQVRQFEEEYARFSGTKYCAGVGSGLDALILALRALDIGRGDEVIVPANTYIATWMAVTAVGAVPVPVDPDPLTYNLKPEDVAGRITRRTKAVIAVNLYGLPAPLAELSELCKQRNIYLIEDNAQAHGAKYRGKPTGSWGIINATSFYPGKNLGALGDGGAVTTDSKELIERVRILRNYGSPEKYIHREVGMNSRLDELQAGFLLVKLKHLEDDNMRRQQIARVYLEELEGIGDLVLPVTPSDSVHVYHQFVVRTCKRDELRGFLHEHGIGTLIHYPVPPHLQEAYRFLGYRKGDFPVTEEIAETVLSLPIYPCMEEWQVELVIDTIKKFFRTRG